MNNSLHEVSNLPNNVAVASLSFRERKVVIMTSQVSLFLAAVSLIYLGVDLTNGIADGWPLQLTAAFLFMAGYILNKRGHHYWAKALLILSGNFIVYLFSILEPIEIGICCLFIICYVAPLICFGFEQRRTIFLLILLTSLLILFSVVIELHLIPKKQYTAEYTKFSLLMNLIVTSITCSLMVYFLVSVNHHSEISLRENEKAIHEKNEALTKANKELDRFVYSTSHDLRSPISSVRGLINVIQLTNDTSEIKSYLEMMENRLIHLDTFISDISNYSRNSRLALNIKPINLNQLVSNYLEGLKFYPKAEKIKLEIEIPADLVMQSDQTRLEILLGNLISNAYKYADHTKAQPFIKIHAHYQNSTVEISIADNGIGIPSQYVPKIFDMFFQAHERAMGSGLGLYIAKETLEKLNGTIRVETEVGKGSTFSVTLPLQYEQSAH